MTTQTESGTLAKMTAAMRRVYGFPPHDRAGQTESTQPWTPPPATAGYEGRYLWTDAFGVLNFLTLHRRAGSAVYLNYAKALVQAVHDVLGRTRDGTQRLPGATEENPLGGGLRIGKEKDEDDPGGDGDGQYHHYLTLWMFALNRLAAASGERRWNDMAVQLARAIHPRFVYARNQPRPRMYWKMSIDLSRPLVRSEGNLDPMDGLAVFSLLQEAAGAEVLAKEIDDYRCIVEKKWRGYSSTDPLDLGMTLWTAHWFAGRHLEGQEWAEGLVARARHDLVGLANGGYFGASRHVGRRLAFREFGTALGIRCALAASLGGAYEELLRGTASTITAVWETAGLVPEPTLEAKQTNLNAADDLAPITLVMYAAAVDPGVFARTDE